VRISRRAAILGDGHTLDPRGAGTDALLPLLRRAGCAAADDARRGRLAPSAIPRRAGFATAGVAVAGVPMSSAAPVSAGMAWVPAIDAASTTEVGAA